MHRRTPRLPLAVALIVALHSSSAQPLSRGDADAFDPSMILPPPTEAAAELYALDMSRIIGTQTMLVRHQATEYQRKVAEARARAYVAAQLRSQAEPLPTSKPARIAKKGKGPAKEPEKQEKPKVAVPPKKKLPRYIAVDTVKDKRSGPEVKKVVMIWDTQSESLVGNNIYDVQNPPPVGSTTKFETYSANYIGAGL